MRVSLLNLIKQYSGHAVVCASKKEAPHWSIDAAAAAAVRARRSLARPGNSNGLASFSARNAEMKVISFATELNKQLNKLFAVSARWVEHRASD